MGRACRMNRKVRREQAVSNNGKFANQNTAAKLRQEFTIKKATDDFGLEA